MAEEKKKVESEEARQAETNTGMRYVLAGSLIIAVIAVILVAIFVD